MFFDILEKEIELSENLKKKLEDRNAINNAVFF